MRTISFEIVEKLKNLGVKRKSYIDVGKEWTPYYTLDEILEMLPANIKDYNAPCGKKGVIFYVLTLTKSNYYCISYDCTGGCETCPCEKECITFTDKENPTEAAGKLLAWCIENGHVKPEEL
jgi:hypothetical protein